MSVFYFQVFKGRRYGRYLYRSNVTDSWHFHVSGRSSHDLGVVGISGGAPDVPHTVH